MIIDKTTNDEWYDCAIGSKAAASILGFNPHSSKFDEFYRIVNMRILTMEQSGDEWLKWREKGIGSSDVASILGLNPYKSKKSLWKDRTQGQVHFKDNKHTIRGKKWEPIVRTHYEMLMGEVFPPVCILSDDYDWARVSLDGRREDGKQIIEIKCPAHENFEKLKVNGLHEYWNAQVAYQLWVSKASLCHCLIFDAENSEASFNDRLLIIPIVRDLLFEEAMIDSLKDFWECIKNKTLP